MLTIAQILDKAALAEALEQIAQLNWRDGAATAGRDAKRVKQNEQADLSGGAGKALAETLRAAIESHPVLRAYAWPKRLSPLLISRTREGGGYGAHVDNAIMGKGERALRADLSFTLFLSPPEDYEGGALEIDQPGETRRFKPEAGDLVVYPSTTLHRVEPVTSGERLACVGWIQSLVRGAERRDVLFDLENVRAELAAKLPPDAPELAVISKSISNLLRLWAEA